MNTLTDQELLRDYTSSRSEAAFAELVRRHVDFVYSAALRMVHDAHTADDVTQGVFMALAENAGKLTDRPILAGWLHRTTQFLASKAIRSEVRRRAREQEAAAMIELSSAEPDAIWQQIAPTLDTTLDELDEADRDVLFLRFFQHKSAREISETLGINEDAAKKRVSRAVERLRELFTKRGITVGAAGIIVAISTNAVHAAPIGLAVGISTAATIGGSTLASTSAATTTKAIAMTTLQKTIVGATLVVAVGTGIHETRQASALRDQVQTLQKQQAPMTGQINGSIQKTAGGTTVTNTITLSWLQIESTNYLTYIANLKAIQCPWSVIKDIIIADVNRMYAPQFSKFTAAVSFTNQYWMGENRLSQRNAEMLRLKEEKRELIRTLLGDDVYDDVKELSGEYSMIDDRYAFLPKGKREKVKLLYEQYTEAENAVYARAGRFYIPEDDKEKERVKREKLEALGKILSPEEIEQLEMRTTQFGFMLRNKDGLNLSEDEFTKAFRVLQNAQATKSSQSELDKNLKEALGEARFNDYKRSDDQAFYEVARLAKRMELPNDVAVDVYGIGASKQVELARIQSDPTMTPEQKSEAQSRIQQAARTEIRSRLGENGFNLYTNYATSAKWLR